MSIPKTGQQQQAILRRIAIRLNKMMRGLLNKLRKRVRKLSYYDKYLTAMTRLEERSAFEEIGASAASLVHDLQTPLAGMRVIIHSTRDKFESNPGITRAMRELEFEIERIRAVLRTITLLRGDTEYFERWMEKVSALEVLHRSIRSLKAATDASAIYFRVDGRDIYLKAYGAMLEQAVVNILKNAVESVLTAEPPDGRILVIIRSDPQTSRRVRIEIVDNGRGMSPECLSEVKALFSAGDTIRNIKGTGLFIAKRVIDIHHGDLTIDSVQGVGTNVLLTFPAWQESFSKREH